jgi:hypothetical protein
VLDIGQDGMVGSKLEERSTEPFRKELGEFGSCLFPLGTSSTTRVSCLLVLLPHCLATTLFLFSHS